MSYYTTRGKTHLVNSGDPNKSYCGKSLEDLNKVTNDRKLCNCTRCLTPSKLERARAKQK